MTKTSLDFGDPAELARCLFEESNDALFLFEPMDMTLLDANPAAQRITNLPRKALLQRTIPELLDADERTLSELLSCCQSTQIFDSNEAYWLTRDSGERLEVNVSVSRLHLKPLPLGLLAVRDVSRQRTVESQLRTSQSQLEDMVQRQAASLEVTSRELSETEQRMREIVDDLDVIVWEATLPNIEFTYVSQHAESMLGYSVGQWMSEPKFWENHIHPDDREQAVIACAESSQYQKDHQFEYRMIAADGTVRWIRDIVHFVASNDRQPAKLRGVMLDITAQSEAESKLRARERDLAHVSRLTPMGQLMASISHEINQPLAAISNFANASLQQVEIGSADSSLHSWLEKIVEQSTRCTDIVARLRQFGRHDSSERTNVSLERILRESLGLLESLLRDHHITTSLDLPANDITVLGNETELQQVMVNLMHNACDALTVAGTESPEIRLRATVWDGVLQLSVSDNGPGISDDLKGRIFDAFFTSKDDGMGLGLAICSSIISRHNGKLYLDEATDGGATFVIEMEVQAPA